MKNKKFWIIVAVVLIVLLAFGLRSYAADHLHIDHDETTYLIAAYQYTNFIQTDQLNWLAWNKTNFEHPVLSKIIFGIALLPHTPIGKIQQSDFIDGTPRCKKTRPPNMERQPGTYRWFLAAWPY